MLRTRQLGRAPTSSWLPRGFLEASSRLPRSFLDASSRLPRSFLEASLRLPRGFLEASSRLPRRFLEASSSLPRPSLRADTMLADFRPAGQWLVTLATLVLLVRPPRLALATVVPGRWALFSFREPLLHTSAGDKDAFLMKFDAAEYNVAHPCARRSLPPVASRRRRLQETGKLALEPLDKVMMDQAIKEMALPAPARSEEFGRPGPARSQTSRMQWTRQLSRAPTAIGERVCYAWPCHEAGYAE